MAESVDPQILKETKRQDFLFKMYDQMFADINRSILVVWQSVGVLLGGAAIFGLVEKQIVTLDIACSIFVVLAGWSIAHSLEAGYWYNRNLIIIANIERQFLRPSDLREVHSYFGKHRPENKLIDQLRLQIHLAGAITFLVLVLHFFSRVKPGFSSPLSSIEWLRAAPYFSCAFVAVYLLRRRKHLTAKYTEFLKESPGLTVEGPEK